MMTMMITPIMMMPFNRFLNRNTFVSRIFATKKSASNRTHFDFESTKCHSMRSYRTNREQKKYFMENRTSKIRESKWSNQWLIATIASRSDDNQSSDYCSTSIINHWLTRLLLFFSGNNWIKAREREQEMFESDSHP